MRTLYPNGRTTITENYVYVVFSLLFCFSGPGLTLLVTVVADILRRSVWVKGGGGFVRVLPVLVVAAVVTICD